MCVGEAKKKLVLIGKGLTFDSGGYNLKAGAGSMIELMKFDMGGAGAVLGAAKAIGQLQPAGGVTHVGMDIEFGWSGSRKWGFASPCRSDASVDHAILRDPCANVCTGVEVHIIVAACENMISAEAYRPGDIITASNGKVRPIAHKTNHGATRPPGRIESQTIGFVLCAIRRSRWATRTLRAA